MGPRQPVIAAAVVAALAVLVAWLGWEYGSVAVCSYYFIIPLAILAAGIVRTHVVPLAVLFYAVINSAYCCGSLAGEVARGLPVTSWLSEQVRTFPWLLFLLAYTLGGSYMLHPINLRDKASRAVERGAERAHNPHTRPKPARPGPGP